MLEISKWRGYSLNNHDFALKLNHPPGVLCWWCHGRVMLVVPRACYVGGALVMHMFYCVGFVHIASGLLGWGEYVMYGDAGISQR
jgi:hypothetical protein